MWNSRAHTSLQQNKTYGRVIDPPIFCRDRPPGRSVFLRLLRFDGFASLTITMSLRGGVTPRRGNPHPLKMYITVGSTKGERIATPVCALVRNDSYFLARSVEFYPFVGEGTDRPGGRSLQNRRPVFYRTGRLYWHIQYQKLTEHVTFFNSIACHDCSIHICIDKSAFIRIISKFNNTIASLRAVIMKKFLYFVEVYIGQRCREFGAACIKICGHSVLMIHSHSPLFPA